MRRAGKNHATLTAAVVLTGFAVAGAAAAAPPQMRGAVPRAIRATDTSAALQGGDFVRSTLKVDGSHGASGPLDLRPPADVRDAALAEAPAAGSRKFLPFPSMHQAAETAGDEERADVGGEAQALRVEARIQQLAHRFQHEGMGAHLWESRSAVVSLGVNPRGKPGLWLFQKVR